MKADEAAKIFDVKENLVKHFKVKDPYNPWELEGYINISEHLYGSMVIFKIDNYLTEQVVISTPKQKYPFDRLGRFKFPSAKHINVYEKYDGTNILAYGYKLKGKYWITYKTRLTPVLTQESAWGNWFNMWNEMKEKYPGLENLVYELIHSGLNPSFELYGSRNKHLIEYEMPLNVVLLFAIQNDVSNPEIIDPKNLINTNWNKSKKCSILPNFISLFSSSIPFARLEVSIDSFEDLYSWYQKLRNQQESINKFTDDGNIRGSEGFVWYLTDINGKTHQYKCKPESVEQIHWAASGLSMNSVVTTVINAYETGDEVTYDSVKELLLEEYTERMVDAHQALIYRAMGEVKQRVEFRIKVLKLYEKLNLNLKENKVGTMRTLSPYFDKKEMSKVFTLLNNEKGFLR